MLLLRTMPAVMSKAPAPMQTRVPRQEQAALRRTVPPARRRHRAEVGAELREVAGGAGADGGAGGTEAREARVAAAQGVEQAAEAVGAVVAATEARLVGLAGRRRDRGMRRIPRLSCAAGHICARLQREIVPSAKYAIGTVR